MRLDEDECWGSMHVVITCIKIASSVKPAQELPPELIIRHLGSALKLVGRHARSVAN